MSQWSITKRPSVLSELYGLENVKKYFYEKAKKKDWPTAVLLRGQFGNGKTTTAKIIASMIACHKPDPITGDACGTCKSCRAIKEERWDSDVMLIDGGQSGKSDVVEQVSEFISTPAFYGSPAKVVIIEEIQELSTAAKNSLLKTLEHPRSGIHFILLSMETGMASGFASRCVPFNFKKVPIKDIMLYLKKVMDEEGVWGDKSIPDEFRFKGLATIAQVSAGSLRQALQLLEQCLSGGFYTAKDIEDNLGFLDESTIIEILVRFLDGDKTVWQALDNFDAFEFFSVGLKIIADAEMYRVSGYLATDNDFFNANTRKVANSPRYLALRDAFATLGPIAKPYLRKTEMMVHLAKAFETKPLIKLSEGASSAGGDALAPSNATASAAPVLNASPAAVPTRSIPLRTRS